MAAIVASQALIFTSFSIIRQSMALGYFPQSGWVSFVVSAFFFIIILLWTYGRSKKHEYEVERKLSLVDLQQLASNTDVSYVPDNILYTSSKHEEQVYSPDVKYFLIVFSILIVVGFKGGGEIGNAYGVGVIWVMLITTCFMTAVMLVVWDTDIMLIGIFFLLFISNEGIDLTSLLNKMSQGGWVSFVVSALFLIIILLWPYRRSKKYEYEVERKLSLVDLQQLTSNLNVSCILGVRFFCTDLINGIPPIIRHYIQNVGSLHQIMVVVTVRILSITSAVSEERFLIGKLGPNGVYRCLVHYGYMEHPSMEDDEYVATVIEKLKELAESNEELQLLETGKIEEWPL
ncbi:potassium transporter 26-like [Amborella trichopoda]|uniref:potassium transporter 26-like n=1 Tax=Amborella trichopoda TaxID=13333 RepID=UPI0009C02C79|nr:potassium transporter 26-like [Amborella trichopoda]|eukprot:XP_020521176.1 potassium transporter 26-like [Amborella trichopoda]